MISAQKLWTLEGIDAALDCASQRKETEISAFLMNERADLVDKSEGNDQVNVDKIENNQETDMSVQEKDVQPCPVKKPLSMRKKRFEL